MPMVHVGPTDIQLYQCELDFISQKKDSVNRGNVWRCGIASRARYDAAFDGYSWGNMLSDSSSMS